MSEYAELIARLREHATDWNGQQMPDVEPAKGDLTAGMLRAAADAIEAEGKEASDWKAIAFNAMREAAQARREAIALRAVSDAARAYFDDYAQDEAEDRECCIEDEQHAAAIRLRDALRTLRAAL